MIANIHLQLNGWLPSNLCWLAALSTELPKVLCFSLILFRWFYLSFPSKSSQMGITSALDTVNMIHNSASESLWLCMEKRLEKVDLLFTDCSQHLSGWGKHTWVLHNRIETEHGQREPEHAWDRWNLAHIALSTVWPMAAQRQKM